MDISFSEEVRKKFFLKEKNRLLQTIKERTWQGKSYKDIAPLIIKWVREQYPKKELFQTSLAPHINLTFEEHYFNLRSVTIDALIAKNSPAAPIRKAFRDLLKSGIDRKYFVAKYGELIDKLGV